MQWKLENFRWKQGKKNCPKEENGFSVWEFCLRGMADERERGERERGHCMRVGVHTVEERERER